MANYIKQKLATEYGIYVKKVRIHGTLNYYGDTFYLPYRIVDSMAGSIVMGTRNMRYYGSLEAILKDAENGNLFLPSEPVRKEKEKK